MKLSKRAVVASVVVTLAVTPTLWDGIDAWMRRPDLRALLLGWYAFVLWVAWSAWRVF